MGADEKSGADAPTDHRAAFSMPGHLLRRCHQISVSIFLDECRELDLTPPQYIALCALAEHGPLDQAALGGVTALDRTTAAVVLRNLRQRRLVRTRVSTKDRRSKINVITPGGLALLDRAHGPVTVAQTRTVTPLTAEEQRQLLALLAKVASTNNGLSRAPQRLRRPRTT